MKEANKVVSWHSNFSIKDLKKYLFQEILKNLILSLDEMRQRVLYKNILLYTFVVFITCLLNNKTKYLSVTSLREFISVLLNHVNSAWDVIARILISKGFLRIIHKIEMGLVSESTTTQIVYNKCICR